MIFERLPVPCDLCEVGLRQAGLSLGPSFVYDLYVHESCFMEAKFLLKHISAMYMDNPMAPYINLQTYPFKYQTSWCLCANERKIGSEGCR